MPPAKTPYHKTTQEREPRAADKKLFADVKKGIEAAEELADKYLATIGDWQDPNPLPVIKEHKGFLVVRDDLLGYGSKIRALDHFVKNSYAKELVYGSCPAEGYAQISLPYLCGRYNKVAVLFMAARDPTRYTDCQKRAIESPALRMEWVPHGMLSVTQARAREYVAQDPLKRELLPMGLEHPTAYGCIIRVARSLLPDGPDEFWTAGGSGFLNRALQLAWPCARAYVVGVGHKLKDREVGRAVHLHYPLPFVKPARVIPPFPSVSNYDAKGWEVSVPPAL